MLITGVYLKTLWRNEITGETRFVFMPDEDKYVNPAYGSMLAQGIIAPYTVRMPLMLTGDFEGPYLFRVRSFEEATVSVDGAVEFLSSSLFDGIGRKTAIRIVEAFGPEVFGFVEKQSAVSILGSIKGITTDKAQQIVDRIKGFRVLRELMKSITALGGTYHAAHALYQKYGEDALTVLHEDPYIGRRYGMSFSVCEHIARQRGVVALHPDRIAALIEEALLLAYSGGNICLPFSRLCDYIGMIERSAGQTQPISPFFIGASLLERRDYFTLKLFNGDLFVYRNEEWIKERELADRVRWLNVTSSVIPVTSTEIDAVEGKLGITYAPQQREAFSLVDFPGVKVLTGGPGTGKTTVLRGLIEHIKMRNPDAQIALCAPTATAARRMRESTGVKASTVHKLLGITPFSSVKPTELTCDVLIVDEASMIDQELALRLLNAVRRGSTILFVGDEEQLESVGPGRFLSGLIAGGLPACRLTEVFRQDSLSSIVENSGRIRGGIPDLKEDTSTIIWRVDTDAELCERAVTAMVAAFDRSEPWKTRLLTPIRTPRFMCSTTNLNKRLQKLLNPLSDNDGIHYGRQLFLPGDPVQMTKNRYEAGYINGDFGIIESVDKEAHTMLVNIDGNAVLLTMTMFPEVELAYASTIHKAQGGECDTCIIVIPKEPAVMVNRRLIYVAATRAKNKNLIIAEADALSNGIMNTSYNARYGGLEYCIKGD